MTPDEFEVRLKDLDPLWEQLNAAYLHRLNDPTTRGEMQRDIARFLRTLPGAHPVENIRVEDVEGPDHKLTLLVKPRYGHLLASGRDKLASVKDALNQGVSPPECDFSGGWDDDPLDD